MVKRFVIVAGNIGSGKTSLTTLVAERLGWRAFYESVDDNPYLADFYADMRTWSFHLQVFFLGHRAELHRRIAEMPESVIQDRSIYEDRHIFAQALRDMNNMAQRDFDAYVRLYGMVVGRLPIPSLLIYLQTSVPTLMQRIASRGRDMESGISADYLQRLNVLYAAWMEGFNLCPVLTIPSDALDFVNSRAHLDIICTRIMDRLQGKEEVILYP
jgi:deoxyadenosine/deoxycytidine kinase